MEAFKSIPKILEDIEDINRNGNSAQALTEYRRNLKEFIKSVTKEVGEIIDRYEKKIATLKEENQRLRLKTDQSRGLPVETAAKKSQKTIKVPGSINDISPVKKRSPLDMMPTAKSKLYSPYLNTADEDAKFSVILTQYRRGRDEDNNFPVELINQEPEDENFHNGKSIFEIRAAHKKQREEELRNFLESGQKSMNQTTERYLQSVGKNKKLVEKNEGMDINIQDSDSSVEIKKKDSVLNQSLGNICNNLDNSLLARKARNSKKKSSNVLEDEAKRKQRHDEEMAQMMKDRGVKNLLLRLRENVESSAKQPPEIIKSSKLVSCGPSKSVGRESLSPSNKNGFKVLINPVPVDIVKKSRSVKKERSESEISPVKIEFAVRPVAALPSPIKSILKQTSSVLTKSLAGISSIEFLDE